MSGSRYQYDEQGLYFYYFMASVLGLVLAPSTYYALTSTSTKPEAKKGVYPTFRPALKHLN
jgi:preprotein translocase subunit Sec63